MSKENYTGSRAEALEVAALCAALNVPNAAQGVAGRRIGGEIVEDRLMQRLAHRLSHRAPVIEVRADADADAESRLYAISRAAVEVTTTTTKRFAADVSGVAGAVGGAAKGAAQGAAQGAAKIASAIPLPTFGKKQQSEFDAAVTAVAQ